MCLQSLFLYVDLDCNRFGVYVMLTFLEVNGIRLNATDEELVEIGLSLAQSEMKYEELLNWILQHKI